jgi:hypothetical protein
VKVRTLVAWSILTGWAGVIGMHVRREYFVAEAAVLEAGARTIGAGTHFYVVRMNGRAMGTATTRVDTADDGFTFDDMLMLDVPALDTVTRAATVTHIELSHALQMRSFTFRLDSKIGAFAARGTMQPDSMLEINVQAGGKEQTSRIPATGGVLLDGALTLRMAAAGRLKPGTEVTVRTFDPSAMDVRATTLRVTATDTLILPDSARSVAGGRWAAAVWDTVPVWRIEQSVGDITIASWVDEDGLIVRAESPLGFEIERTTFELARQEWADAIADPKLAAGYGALIEGTAIASNVKLDDLAALDRLSVRLKGVELEGFDLQGGRQALRGDTLVIVREHIEPAGAGYTLPYRGTDEPLTQLGATPLIQTEDPRIRRAARGAAGGSTDPLRIAERLNRYVYRTLAKEITPSVPSAVQVLEAKRGDCNEHTVLYVALARAVGLPARTAVGLVYVRGRFYYHAWPEIWLAGRWVAVDPTLGQFPADASHLRFIVGGLARQLELIRLIGRLDIEVL